MAATDVKSANFTKVDSVYDGDSTIKNWIDASTDWGVKLRAQVDTYTVGDSGLEADSTIKCGKLPEGAIPLYGIITTTVGDTSVTLQWQEVDADGNTDDWASAESHDDNTTTMTVFEDKAGIPTTEDLDIQLKVAGATTDTDGIIYTVIVYITSD